MLRGFQVSLLILIQMELPSSLTFELVKCGYFAAMVLLTDILKILRQAEYDVGQGHYSSGQRLREC